jgi:hypothetical protein
VEVEIDLNCALRLFRGLSQAGWAAADIGIGVLDNLGGFSYRAQSMKMADAAALYGLRADIFRESGGESVDLARFVEALDAGGGEDVFVFSVRQGSWSCVCAALSDDVCGLAVAALRSIR